MSAPEAKNSSGPTSYSDHDINFNWQFCPTESNDHEDCDDLSDWAASPFSDISNISMFRQPVWLAVERLYLATRLAADCECARQEFSIRWDELSRMDLRREELKWLILKNIVKKSESLHHPEQNKSDPANWAEFVSDATFVITNLGVELVEQCLREIRLREPANGRDNRQAPLADQELKPAWDGERHELRCAGQVVKKFKWRAANQETILATFEEEGWPAHIDDPLPQEPHIDPKRRLADAIKSLNRHQKISLVRFCGDGTGQGVLWELK